MITRRKSLLLLAAPAIIRARAQVPTTHAGKGAPGGGASPVVWTPTANPVGQNTSSTTATFSGVAIGSPASADVIVATVFTLTSLISSLTCNGAAMMKQAEAATIAGTQVWSITAGAASVAGSASTTFVMTAGGSTNDQTLQVGKISSTATPTPTNSGNTATGTGIAVTVPASGVAIIAAGMTATGALTWTGGVQDFLTVDAGGGEQIAMVHTFATGTVSQTPVASGTIQFAYAAWSP